MTNETIIAEKVLKEIEYVLVNPLLESEQQDVAAIIERELFKARNSVLASNTLTKKAYEDAAIDAQKETESAVLHVQEECRKEMQFKIIEAETKILNAAHSIEQERVRKLKAELKVIHNCVSYLRKSEVGGMNVIADTLQKSKWKIDQIFPDCAEKKAKGE